MRSSELEFLHNEQRKLTRETASLIVVETAPDLREEGEEKEERKDNISAKLDEHGKREMAARSMKIGAIGAASMHPRCEFSLHSLFGVRSFYVLLLLFCTFHSSLGCSQTFPRTRCSHESTP